jgi:hypothetical protein
MATHVELTPEYCPQDKLVTRLAIDTRLRLPDPNLDLESESYRGIIDTGAQRTLIPRQVVDWFQSQAGGFLIKGPPITLVVADGHEYQNVPGYYLDMKFTIRADPTNGKHGMTFVTGPKNRGEIAPLCYALPASAETRTVMSRQAVVLIGMDVLRNWKTVIDGPGSKYFLEIG